MCLIPDVCYLHRQWSSQLFYFLSEVNLVSSVPPLTFFQMGLGKFRSRFRAGPITTSSIMKAILVTTGPVNNCSAFLHSGPTHMRHVVTPEQYNDAALQLQEMGMGELVEVDVVGNVREVFIKKEPKQAEEILARNPDLCQPLVYALRYFMPLPSKFRIKMRQKLVELGFVTEDQVFRTSKV